MQRIKDIVGSSPFIRHNAVFFAGSLVVGALNYLFYPVLGRLMHPAQFGEVQTLTALFSQTAIFLSILTYVTVYVTVNTTDEAERNQLVLGVERFAIQLGLGLLVITLLLAPFMRSFLHFSSIWPFMVIIATIGVSIPLVFRMAYLRGRKQFARTVTIDAIGSATKLLLAPALVLAGLRTVGALLGIFISQIVSLVIGYVWAWRAGLHGTPWGQSSVNYKALAPQLRHAAALLCVSLYAIAIQTLDIIAIKHFFPPEQAGRYAGIATVANIVYFLTTPFVGVLISMVNQQQTAHKNRLQLGGALALVAIFGGAAAVIMALFPKLVIGILVGPKYLEYAHVLPLLAGSMFLSALTTAMLMYHIALKQYIFCVIAVLGVVSIGVLVAVRHSSVQAIVQNMIIVTICVVVVTAFQTITNQQRGGTPAHE